MARLGYSRYVAQGGDWGSAITSVIGATDAEHCAMIGLTLAMSARPTGEPSTPAELHAVERIQYYMQWDSGYSTQQRTRPQTVGYGLTEQHSRHYNHAQKFPFEHGASSLTRPSLKNQLPNVCESYLSSHNSPFSALKLLP